MDLLDTNIDEYVINNHTQELAEYYNIAGQDAIPFNELSPSLKSFYFQKTKENKIKDKDNGNHSMGVCNKVSQPYGVILQNEWNVRDYFDAYLDWDINIPFGPNLSDNIVANKILEHPNHGLLYMGDINDPRTYIYEPQDDFVGNDTAIVEAKVNGLVVNIHYIFAVKNDYCETKQIYKWKVSSNFGNEVAPTTHSTYDVNFANLSGSIIGETKGYANDSVITLDTEAAGHGWYIGGMTNLAN